MPFLLTYNGGFVFYDVNLSMVFMMHCSQAASSFCFQPFAPKKIAARGPLSKTNNYEIKQNFPENYQVYTGKINVLFINRYKSKSR